MVRRQRPALLAGGAAAAIALVVVLVIAAPRVAPEPIPPSLTTPPGFLGGRASPASPSESPAPSVVVEPTPKPPVATLVSVSTKRIRSPLGPRIQASGVWTGKEVILWGGLSWSGMGVRAAPANGAAYDPEADTWRMLPDAPIGSRHLHQATWTGREMLLWGGWTSIRPKPPAAGAAYNPKTRTWRALAPSPMNWATGATSVWADGEWVIAIARDRTDGIEVVAYDPKRDRWRHLPRIPGQLSHENQLVWTGTELLLMNAADGMYRLAAGAEAWTEASAESERIETVVWTGDRLLGLASNYPRSPTLVVWDPVADSWSGLPQPESDPFEGFIWIGDRALLTNSGLAFDPSTSEWWDVEMPPVPDRSDSVLLWAGDRLLELGGWPGGPSGPIHFGDAYIPEW